MPSFNVALLDNAIVQDIPGINLVLQALAKQDVSTFTDIPEDSKRMVVDSNNRITFQFYKNNKWTTFTKILHDVDTVDGFHAAVTPNANTIAVRNADKKLEGDITGNAATATTAGTISGTLPINKGGTNATTAEKARENLGAPPKSHASSSNIYGIATNELFGHVKANTETTEILAGEVVAKDIALGADVSDLASKRGQLGECAAAPSSIKDFNNYIKSGCWWFSSSIAAACANRPSTSGGHLVVHAAAGNKYIQQIYFEYTGAHVYKRVCNNGTWSDWIYVVFSNNTATISAYGITKLTSAVNSTSEVLAATAKAAKIAYDKGVEALNKGIEAFDKASVIATTTVVGNVKIGTGLTIDAAGLLKVALNNTVTSTSTAVAATANAVKTAYDKAVEALNKANSAVSSNGKVSLRATRKVKGTWTITGLTIGKPLYVLHTSTADNIYNAYVNISVLSGSKDAIIAGNSLRYQIGRGSIGLPNVIVVIPTATSVSFEILNMVGNEDVNILNAYQ